MSRTAVIFGGASGIGDAIKSQLMLSYGIQATTVDASYGADIVMKFPRDYPPEYQENQEKVRQLKPIDLCFITLGSPSHRMFVYTPRTREEELVTGNFTAVTDVLRLVTGLMSSDGSIVLTSSVSASRADQGGAIYAAAKAGLEALIRALAREMAPMRFNAIAPGPTATRQFLDNVPDENQAKEMSRSPHNRLLQPMEVADAAVKLATMTGVSGVVLPVDLGGLSSSRRPI